MPLEDLPDGFTVPTRGEVRDRFQKLGAEIVGNSPEEFRRMLESEQKLWAKVVKDSGAKVE